jgi:hypothetical protein
MARATKLARPQSPLKQPDFCSASLKRILKTQPPVANPFEFLMSNAKSAAATQTANDATPSGERKSQSRSVRLPGEDLSLNEMLRVMDVAREMRRNRDLAEEMFRRDEIRVELRGKLMRSAQLAGDRVTEAEVDAAIDQYFATLHTYEDPKPGLKRMAAHAWVWRKRIAAGVAAVAITLGGAYYLFFSSSAPLSPSVQAERAVAAEQETAAALVQRIDALTNDQAVIAKAQSLQAELNAARGTDVTTAIAAREQLAQMVDQLSLSYEVHIVSAPNQPSLIDRGMDGKDSVYYVIVEARDSTGKVIPQSIRDVETGQVKTVSRWAEEVPQSVYQRLREDKTSDGLLSETLFSTKVRGELQPTIKIVTPSGAPVTSGNRLTQWN